MPLRRPELSYRETNASRHMLARRIGVGSAVALAGALLTHAAVFGMAHAAGGVHAARLDAILAAALGLVISGAFLRSALDRAAPFARHGCTLPLALGPGALGAYALIECSEGRAPLAGGIAILIGWAFAAFVASCAARCVARIATRSGAALCALASHVSRERHAAWRTIRRAVTIAVMAFVPARSCDRAPPLAR